MKLSTRITGLLGGGSDGWDVFLKAREMIAAGVPVIELTIGEHDIRTDPIILDHMYERAIAGHTGYASIPGVPALRETIAKRVTERTGTKATPDNVLITAGGQAALFASHMAACDPGDVGLFIDPYYATYPGTVRSAGAIPRPVQASPEHGFQPQAADIAAAAAGAKSLLINSPNNPTGAVYIAETMTGIAQVCQNHDLWLISDEVYDTQIWTGTHISPRTLPDMAQRTIVVGSMSKSHAMTGSRVGWVLAPEEVIEHLINLSTNTNYGVTGFLQDAALFALNQGPAFEEKIAAPFRRRRDIVTRILAGSNVVRAVPCDGAMYAMIDIRATGMTGEAFAYALLDAEHVAVMPGESFGDAAAGHLRVAMTVDDTAFEDAFTRLVRFAETQAAAT